MNTTYEDTKLVYLIGFYDNNDNENNDYNNDNINGNKDNDNNDGDPDHDNNN